MNFSRTKPEPIQFPLAPMIDVIFLLLCFFVTSQLFSQWESEMDITLPTSQTGNTPQRLQGELILNVYADGRLVVNGRTLSTEGLGEMLKRVSALFPGHPVVIRGDENTDYRHIVMVMDRCRAADIYNISFATGIPE